MSSLAKYNPGATPAAASDNPWASAGAGAGSTTFVKFKGSSGDFLAGQDETEIPYGSRFAADVENSKWNWTFWWEGEVLETIEVDVSEFPRAWENEPDFLPDDYKEDMTLEEIRKAQANTSTTFMDGWSCQAVLGMREIGGDGEEYTIKLNQGVALSAFRAMLQTYGRQFRFKHGLVPIIELDARSYKSKKKGVGTRYSPVLKIVNWMSEEDLLNAAGDGGAEYDDEDRAAAPPAEPKQIASATTTDPAPADAGARRGRRGANYG
jgi:hypothetical protein